MFSQELLDKAEQTIQNANKAGIKICCAESCTGGLLSALFTEIAGSSAVFERGFVTYSNKAKQECLGVAGQIILAHGAVSHQSAQAMAQGALNNSHAELAIAITGIAGPASDDSAKPVGLVYIATAKRYCDPHEGDIIVTKNEFGNLSRQEVRLASINKAVEMLQEAIDEKHKAEPK